ncbi:Protein of unknown function (DUF3429) domain containing protein [Rhypophila sp. PSN 637]
MMRGSRPLLRAAQGLSIAARPALRQPPLQTLLRAAAKPPTTSTRIVPLLLQAQFSTKLPSSQRDVKLEKEVAQQKLSSHPERVTTTSSIPGYVEGENAPSDPEMPKGSELVSDLNTVKETLALNNVPREPYALGLAGTLPYLATSCGTVYFSWVLNTDASSTLLNNFLVSKDTATYLLQTLEPIQVGYGAVIISFLGAIHWGMEYAEKSSPMRQRTRFRYVMGVAAPMLAWPTIFMPVEWALITQFLSFTGLYLADLRATTRGWTPGWYSNYRFVLTAIVGAAIFLSLVGRAKVGQGHNRLSTDELRERFGLVDKDSSHDWEKEEEEERQRIKKEKAEEEKKKQAAESEKKTTDGDKKASDGEKKASDGDKKASDGDKKASDGDKESSEGEDKKEA